MESGVQKTSVKVCGLTRREDALHAAGKGAEYLGVVLVADTPRFRTPKEAKDVLSGVAARSVIVVANQDVEVVSSAAEIVGPDVIQLHGEESPEFVEILRGQGPWAVWKAVKVQSPDDLVKGISRFGKVVDGLLLDTWHPTKGGGTGMAFSWEAVADVRDKVPDGLLLGVAGGLTPENVPQAVAHLRPHVVDVSSGVEKEPGIKSPSRVEDFIRNARRVSEKGRAER